MQAQLKMAPQAPATGKEAMVDAVLNARSAAQDMLGGFLRLDRAFKYKVFIVALWATLSASSVFVACPSAMHGPSNSLGARVEVRRVPAGLNGHITALLIENRSSDDWQDVMLKLNGVYTASVPSLFAGRRVVIQLDKFSDGSGTAPPSEMRPQLLEIRCSEGDESIDDLPPPIE